MFLSALLENQSDEMKDTKDKADNLSGSLQIQKWNW